MEFHRDFQLLFAPMSANGTMLQFQNAEKQMETRVEVC